MARPPLTVLIVDDEPPARLLLRLLCEEAGLTVVGEAPDGPAALRQVESSAPQLVLLDIAMPGMDGMTVARTLAAAPSAPAIVFTTAFAQHAVAAFDVGAIDYLLKPIDPDRLSLAIDRVCAEPQSVVNHLWLPHGANLIRVPLGSVTRIDADRDYVRVHAAGRSFLLRETMESIARRLPTASFLRLHRSTIVRRDAVAGLRHEGDGVWSALLADNEAVRIGRTYLAAVRGAVGVGERP